PEGGQVPDASVWAFQAKPGEESPVIEGETSYLVFRLDSLQAEGVPQLAAIHREVEARVRLEKKRALAKELDRKLAERAKQGTSLKQLAQGPGLSYREIGPVARLNTGLSSPDLIGAAFGAPKGGISGPVAAEDGVYLFQGIDRTAADSADF